MELHAITDRIWHSLSVTESLEALESRRQGLTAVEVADRRRAFGPNELPRPQRTGPVVIYLRQFQSPLIYLLLVAAVISLLIGEFADAGFIFLVLQVNACVGAVQEYKAELSAAALDSLIPNWSVVRRNGVRVQIRGEDIVPGDIVFADSGARIAADIRLISCHELKVDESLLTGESLPVGKNPDAVLAAQAPLGDRVNMLHAGTVVLNGRVLGVVTQTGVHTQVGRIAQALTVAGTPPPLVLRLRYFTRVIAIVFCAVIAMLATAQFLRGTELLQIFFTAVALAVAAIPEGLPVAITVALAIGTNRMAQRQVVVRSLPAVEGLGACTLVASDKTGTLTCNELTIKRLVLPGGERFEVTGEGYVPVGTVTKEGEPPELGEMEPVRRLARAGALCNEAGLHLSEEGEGYDHFGDTVDVAFLALAGKLEIERAELLQERPQAGFIPFESYRRYAASFHRRGDQYHVYVKGAAEVVLAMCDGVGAAGIVDVVGRLAAEGYRVLALASGPVTAEAAAAAAPEAVQGLEFLGLAGIIDPVRPEVPDAVRRCVAAGVTVDMVTGDHPGTALAIARELGIVGEEDEEVVLGMELAELANDPTALRSLCSKSRVFARVEPMQKLMVVEALQRSGHFVAVTGDGVNDAPALGVANIGVAMGKYGTDVARAAADLILADDNFASIVNGIEEGRVAYDNVRKVIYLLISTGASEIVVFFLALAWGLPLPLFAVQLLWLNLVTNGIQDVALAFEKGEPDVLSRRPRPPDQPIFDYQMVEQTVLSGAFIGIAAFFFFRWCLDHGWSEFEARNALLLLMVLFENVHVFNCRSENRSAFRQPFKANPFVIVAVVLAQGVHIGAMYVPGLRDVLDVQPVSFETWLEVAAISVSLLVVMEVYKLLRAGRQRAGAGNSTRARRVFRR